MQEFYSKNITRLFIIYIKLISILIELWLIVRPVTQSFYHTSFSVAQTLILYIARYCWSRFISLDAREQARFQVRTDKGCGPLWWSKMKRKDPARALRGVSVARYASGLVWRLRSAGEKPQLARSHRYPRRPHPRSLLPALYPSHFSLFSFSLFLPRRWGEKRLVLRYLDSARSESICILATRLLHLRDPRFVRLLGTCILTCIWRQIRSTRF